MSTRREMLRALVASIGAGALVPGVGAEHPFSHHAADPARLDQADANAKAREYTLEFLDQHQFDTLTSLAEQIVPGSTQAKVSEFIDQLLAVDRLDDQRDFVSALGAFEGQALSRGGRPWKELAAAQQVAILNDASTMASGKAASGKAAGRASTKSDPAVGPGTAAPVMAITLRDHFDLLKGWISGAYYSSEIGMRELGWTGNVFHRAFPGCDHPDGHA